MLVGSVAAARQAQQHTGVTRNRLYEWRVLGLLPGPASTHPGTSGSITAGIWTG